MDHRCLYGHRVPSTFAFAIQNRMCPMCGASTVTVTGYQAARKLATDAGLDAVAAFNVIKIIESEWSLEPLSPSDTQADAPSTPAAAVAAPITAPGISMPPPRVVQPAEDEVVVEESVVESEELTPEPRVARPAPVAVLSMDNVAAVAIPPAAPVNITARVSRPQAKATFDAKDEDFFKGN